MGKQPGSIFPGSIFPGSIFGNLPTANFRCHSVPVSYFGNHPEGKDPRAPRVKLAGTVLALLQLENGQQVRARLHQLSFTGGLLQLEKPLDEGIKIELMFHVGNCTVRSQVSLLFPMWATQGYLQPFQFTDLAEEDRRKLELDLEKFLNCQTAGTPEPEQALGAASDSAS
jgi:hypothetical protein